MKKLVCVLFFIAIFCGQCLSDETLNLEDSSNIALGNNYSIIAARQKVSVAEGNSGIAKSSLLPHLNLSGNLSRQYQSPYIMKFSVGGVQQVVSAGFDEPSNNSSYGINLQQSLFTFGKLLTAVDIANLTLEIEKLNLRSQEQDVIFETIMAYYNVIKAIKFVDLAQESIDMSKFHLSQVNAMFEQGMLTRADTLRFEVQLSQSEQGMIKAKNGLEIAKSVFNTVLSRNIETDVALDTVAFASAETDSLSFGKLALDMFGYSPEWIKLLLTKKISENNLAIAAKGYLPTFSLSGSYGGSTTDYKNNNLNFSINSWNMMVGGSWDIFNGFKTMSEVYAARATVAATDATIENAKKRLTLDLKQAYLDLYSSRNQILAAQKSVDLSRENLRLARLKYKSGMGTNIEVVDAQTALTKSEADYITAAFDYLLSKERINKIIGKRVLK